MNYIHTSQTPERTSLRHKLGRGCTGAGLWSTSQRIFPGPSGWVVTPGAIMALRPASRLSERAENIQADFKGRLTMVFTIVLVFLPFEGVVSLKYLVLGDPVFRKFGYPWGNSTEADGWPGPRCPLVSSSLAGLTRCGLPIDRTDGRCDSCALVCSETAKINLGTT